MSCWKTRDLTIALCVFKYTRKLLDISSAIILPLILYGRNHDLANAWHGSFWLHHMDGYISGMLATGNVYLTVVYMWNNNHKPVSWYLISQRSTCPNPLLFVTFSLQLDSDGNGSDQNISEYSYGLFAYLKCRPVDLSNLIESSLVNLSIYLSTYLYFFLCVIKYLSIYPSIHPSIYLSDLSIYLI